MSLTAIDISLISVGIASAAFIVTLTTLWKNHFAKFNVIVAAGDLQHRIYPIKSGDEEWFMVSFDIPLSLTNSGAKPGMVTGMRLKLHYSNLPIPDNHEYIYPNFIIDPKKSNQISKNRFRWIESLVLSRWVPFIILPKSNISKHVVFETRWDDPVIQEEIDCCLEIETEYKQNWLSTSSWCITLSPSCWKCLAIDGESMSYSQQGLEGGFCIVQPVDLHKYTGSKDPLPVEKEKCEPSYLNYPTKES